MLGNLSFLRSQFHSLRIVFLVERMSFKKRIETRHGLEMGLKIRILDSALVPTLPLWARHTTFQDSVSPFEANDL